MLSITPLTRHLKLVCNGEGEIRPQDAKAASSVQEDTLTIPRRVYLRRAIVDTQRRILAKQTDLEAARRRRAMARRFVFVMSAAAVIFSVVTLALTFSPLAPISAAVWVVPSAFGGSAVAQSVLAMREGDAMRQIRNDIYAMQSLLNQMRRELARLEK